MGKASEIFRKDIKSYLDSTAAIDELFAKKYENSDKSIEECCDFIVTQVRNGKTEGYTDAEIYGLAIHYYEEDTNSLGKIEKGLTDKCRIVVNHEVELTEEEIASAKKAAIDAYQKKVMEEIANRRKKKAVTVESSEEPTLF